MALAEGAVTERPPWRAAATEADGEGVTDKAKNRSLHPAAVRDHRGEHTTSNAKEQMKQKKDWETSRTRRKRRTRRSQLHRKFKKVLQQPWDYEAPEHNQQGNNNKDNHLPVGTPTKWATEAWT